jgi:hypothetical protein
MDESPAIAYKLKRRPKRHKQHYSTSTPSKLRRTLSASCSQYIFFRGRYTVLIIIVQRTASCCNPIALSTEEEEIEGEEEEQRLQGREEANYITH